jgi:predicted nucleic-acid-binding Zn-ribbon protein
MRTTATCPKCSGKKIVVTDLCEVRDNKGVPIPVLVGTIRMSIMGKTIDAGKAGIGSFESWICAACGYTEFYAKDLGDVDALAAARPDAVRIVDSTLPARGPFR